MTMTMAVPVKIKILAETDKRVTQNIRILS